MPGKLTGPSSSAELVLHVVEGHHGIPSVDPLSAQLIYLLRLHDIKRVAVKTSKYYVSAELPRLEYENQVITNPFNIRHCIEDIIDKHCEDNTPYNHINDKYPMHYGPIHSHLNIVETFIKKMTLVNGWGSDDNIGRSLKLYSKGVYYPFKSIFIRRLKSRMDKEMAEVYKCKVKTEVIKKLYLEVYIHLQNFSKLLGDKPFLFGKYPTTLDVHLCSYLAPALLFNYPNNGMKQLIYSCDENLQLYIRKFVDLYGDDVRDKPRIIKAPSDRASIPVMLAAGFFTIATMVIFVKIHGVFKK